MKNLDIKDLEIEPIKQFMIWFDDVVKSNIIEKNAMILGTVTDNKPTQRTLLLKEINANGFIFYTNHNSVKATSIAKNNNVSLLFPWHEIKRQVIVIGNAYKISEKKSSDYFISRPKESKIGAWASNQSSIIDSRETLLKKVKHYENKFSGEIPKPNFWGGYEVMPSEVEFWQLGKNRLHDRFKYTLKNNHWQINRLSP